MTDYFSMRVARFVYGVTGLYPWTNALPQAFSTSAYTFESSIFALLYVINYNILAKYSRINSNTISDN
jgi:hypothetical protein